MQLGTSSSPVGDMGDLLINWQYCKGMDAFSKTGLNFKSQHLGSSFLFFGFSLEAVVQPAPSMHLGTSCTQ